MLLYVFFITGPNEVVAKVMFLQVSVILLTGGMCSQVGGCVLPGGGGCSRVGVCAPGWGCVCSQVGGCAPRWGGGVCVLRGGGCALRWGVVVPPKFFFDFFKSFFAFFGDPAPPPGSRLRHMVNGRPVCILVFFFFTLWVLPSLPNSLSQKKSKMCGKISQSGGLKLSKSISHTHTHTHTHWWYCKRQHSPWYWLLFSVFKQETLEWNGACLWDMWDLISWSFDCG